jgi:hypothetical protein
MRTTYCPESHKELASHRVGREYGHVPGHQYHDVNAILTRRFGPDDKFRCQIVEVWGSAQGFDEEHGRREVVGRGDSIREAIESASLRATAAGIAGEAAEYLVQVLSRVEDDAEEFWADYE